MPLHLELALICQVCDEVLFAESVDHGPTKNGAGWLAWTLERAARHQAGECKGKRDLCRASAGCTFPRLHSGHCSVVIPVKGKLGNA